MGHPVYYVLFPKIDFLGNFDNGKYSGLGTFTYSYGDQYYGPWNHGNLQTSGKIDIFQFLKEQP
jgi:hypothetical protein